jgi:hypothetical protein
MPQHAALVAVNILTAGKLRDFFVMGCSAGHVLQEGVSFARKCGTCFSFMLELAKIQIAMCRGAGISKSILEGCNNSLIPGGGLL